LHFSDLRKFFHLAGDCEMGKRYRHARRIQRGRILSSMATARSVWRMIHTPQARAFVSLGRFLPVSLPGSICQQFNQTASGKQFGFPFGFPSFPVSTLGVLPRKRASCLPGKHIFLALFF
jgi:hypothetical protein